MGPKKLCFSRNRSTLRRVLHSTMTKPLFARSAVLFASLAFTFACDDTASSGKDTPDGGRSDAGHENGGSGGDAVPGAGG
jgi:hypothetical protein